MEFPPQVQKYFDDHKIIQQVLEDFKVGWNGKQIVYPIFNSAGEMAFHIYRQFNRDPRFLYELGSHVALYGIDKVQKEKTILIVEGLSDMLCAWSQGVPAVTSTGGALSFQASWKDLLCDKKIIICLDSDRAGGEGTAKILDIFPEAKVILLPERKGQKDLSDFISSGGDLHKLLKTARNYANIDEIKDDMSNRLALWQNTWFHTAYLENHREKPVESAKKAYRGGGDDLQRAKNFPIDRLIKFGRDHKAPCVAHSEKIPSMHYFSKTNTCYCFSCNKKFDSVDIYMAQNNCDFKTAIKFLS